MKKKISKLVKVTAILLSLFSLTACVNQPGPMVGLGDKVPNVVADIADKMDPIVYIPEGNIYQPYYVVSKDYNGKALLMRKYVLDAPRIVSKGDAFYEGCELDHFLNEEFLDEFGAFSEYILSSEICVLDKTSLGNAGKNTKMISRKIFVLSASELGIAVEETEGAGLDYFRDPEKRIAHLNNGEVVNWWLRTPDSNERTVTYLINKNNKVLSTNSNELNYLRPVFCVDGNASVKKIENINQSNAFGYVIDIAN